MSQSTTKVKAAQLWGKNKEDLTKQLGELKTELGQLRIQKVTSSGAKLQKMYAFPAAMELEGEGQAPDASVGLLG